MSKAVGGTRALSGLAVQNHGRTLESAERVVIAGHGQPADSGFFQQAAGDLDREWDFRMVFQGGVGPLDPHAVRAQRRRSRRPARPDRSSASAPRARRRESGQVLIGHCLTETVEGQRFHTIRTGAGFPISGGEDWLQAGQAFFFLVGGGISAGLGFLLVHGGRSAQHFPIGGHAVGEPQIGGWAPAPGSALAKATGPRTRPPKSPAAR